MENKKGNSQGRATNETGLANPINDQLEPQAVSNTPVSKQPLRAAGGNPDGDLSQGVGHAGDGQDAQTEGMIDEEGLESFPASDPPSHTPAHA